MLAVVLTLGVMPVYGTFASAVTDEPAIEMASETPAPSVEPDTSEPAAAPAPQGEPEATPTPSAEVTPSQEPEASPTPSETPTESPEPENTTYANSISGVLWIDANEDGTYDAGEQPLADYPVYLYAESDQDNAVDTATTDADGKYEFIDISPGRYVVGIKAEENGTDYLLPMVGVQNDNKFYFAPDWSKVISNPIDIDADTVVTDIDAAMRTMPQIQPMANTSYTIDIGSSTLATDIVTIPGVTYASNVLTFTNTVDPTDTYILTGTTTTVRVVVATGATANITLSGVNITYSVNSPFELQGTANVILTLADGTSNALQCISTDTLTNVSRAGITVPVGCTITINGSTGSLSATAGSFAAGIGGYSYYVSAGNYPGTSAGKITINGGIITATGDQGAGIGGGGGGSNGGAITINGGTVTANGGSAAAGIGGGSGTNGGGNAGTVIINDGTVIATGGNWGPGIGGGFYNMNATNGGTVTINGGMVTATGGAYSSGIGVGAYNSTTHGAATVNITGGTVIATGGARNSTGTGYAAGIGGSASYNSSSSSATTGTNIFTGGSIYPRNTAGTVSVAANTTNGSANGSTLLYMTTVTVVDASSIPVANALVSVERPTYTYKAYTNSSGIAYIWVPTGNQLFEGEHDDYGYGSTNATVAANNNNAVTIVLGMRTTLSRTPNTIAFISATNPTPVTLGAKAENKDTGALKDIISAQWFRVETTDITYTASKTSFDSGFAAASSSNKGDDTTNLVETTGGTSSEKNYTMPVSENGKYWVMVHYKDGLGVDRYQVKSIVIDNIYTPSTGNYKGINSGDSSTLYDEAIPGLTNASGDPIVGVAFELNSTATILTSTSDGTTAVAGTGASLTINAKNLTPLWITSAPTSQVVSVTGTNLGTTTFNYTLNPLAITVQFNSQGGTPSTIANQYYMSTDTFGTLPSVARTGYNLDGWFTAATGGTQVNATDTAGSHFTSGSTVTLYAQWTASAKTVTISNEVTGTHANMTKAFTFTVYFEDSASAPLASGTQFTYTGGIIAGSGATAPSGGTLTLDSAGKTTVPLTLTTGQTITIAGVATSGKVRVVQTTDANYTTSFKDSLDASSTSGADTGVRSMTAADRMFDFTNTRSVVPGGISTGSGGIVLLSLMALLALAAGLIITAVHRRRAGAR